MPYIRLFGLMLFITSIILALAAAATRTTHIRFKNIWWNAPPSLTTEQAPEPTWSTTQDYRRLPGLPKEPVWPQPPTWPIDPSVVDNLPSRQWQPPQRGTQWPQMSGGTDEAPTSTAVPVALPLAVLSFVGLVLWFVRVPSRIKSPVRKRKRSPQART